MTNKQKIVVPFRWFFNDDGWRKPQVYVTMALSIILFFISHVFLDSTLSHHYFYNNLGITTDFQIQAVVTDQYGSIKQIAEQTS